MSKTQPVPFFILKLFNMRDLQKYRVVLVNSRGYSVQFEVQATREDIENMKTVLSTSEGLAVVRFDLLV